jgi:hypothetical protein
MRVYSKTHSMEVHYAPRMGRSRTATLHNLSSKNIGQSPVNRRAASSVSEVLCRVKTCIMQISHYASQTVDGANRPRHRRISALRYAVSAYDDFPKPRGNYVFAIGSGPCVCVDMHDHNARITPRADYGKNRQRLSATK